MRPAIVIAAVIALVAGLWFAFSTEPTAPGIEPARVEPDRTVEPAVEPVADLEEPERSAGIVDSVAGRSSSTAVSSAVLASIVLVATDAGGAIRAVDLAIDCRDGLARPIELAADSEGARRASGLTPGEYTISASALKVVTAVERITVKPIAEEQRFEIRMIAAPTVRVHWQTEDGRPVLDALRTPGVLAAPVLARVALDRITAPVGASALNSRQSTIFNIDPAAPRGAPQREAWPGAPPDAVCEFHVTTPPPWTITASIDGTIVGSAPVAEGVTEVIVRTPLDLLRRLRATVRFCLVDDLTGEPVGDAKVSGQTLANVGRSEIDVGIDGCRVDPRFSAGLWLLTFSAPGHGKLRREVELAPGADLDLGALRLEPPRRFAVRATHPDGTRATAVQLAMHSAERTAWGGKSTVTTNAEGEATFTDLPREQHVLFVSDPRYASRVYLVEPRAGREAEQYFELRVEAGVEIALDFGPLPSTDARAFLHDAGGYARSPLWIPISGLVPLRLVPGEYVVELEGASGARAFTVKDESAVFDVR